MRVIVKWCLERASVVILATLLILAAGIFGATQLRQQYFPDINFPFLIVSVKADGYSARAVDEQVEPTLVRAVKSLPSVTQVTTVATEGEARMYAQMAFGTDTKAAQRSFTEEVARLGLPSGVKDPEFQGGFSQQAVLIASLSSSDLPGLTRKAQDWKKQVEAIDGVAKVEVSGGTERQAQVTLKPQALRGGLTPLALATAIRDAGSTTPAGVVSANGFRVPVVVTGAGVADVARLSALPIAGGTTVGQVADVKEVDDPSSGFARTNGQPALSFSVFRTEKANEVQVVQQANHVLDSARKVLGKQNVATIIETATPVRNSIKGLLIEAGLGALFAVFVIALFLREWRATLVAAVSIPTSIVFGLLAGWTLGLTLNIITLAGLTIAIGRVIDDGIVVLENIHKHLERGEHPWRAAIDGTTEVAKAIASSTLATAAVFLPIGLVGGFISEIFLSFSIIVTCALLASFVVAITVIPVLAALVLKPREAAAHTGAKLARFVTPATRFGVRHRWIVIGAALLAFVGTIAVVAGGAIPTQFLPDSGTQQVFGTVALPPGTTTVSARTALQPAEREIRAIHGVKDYQVAFGGASLQFGDPSQAIGAATFVFTVAKGVDAAKVVTDLRAKGERLYPHAFTVQRIENGPPSGSFQATLRSDSQASLAAASDQVAALLQKRTDVHEVHSDASRAQPQLTVQLKPGATVAPEAVSATIVALSAAADGGTLGNGTRVAVAAPSSVIGDPAALASVPVGSGTTGATAPASTNSPTLGQVATLQQTQQPAIISRDENGKYIATVSARLQGSDTAGTISTIKAGIAKLHLGATKVDYNAGDAKFIGDMFRDLGIAMLTAIVLVYLVLVVFFGSLGQPITILAPVLFSFVGSLLALVVTGRALGLPAMIGQLLLIGIVVANSILLVDTALRLRRTGMARADALVEAARLRVRPVLMTALATMAALLPLAIGVSGEGGLISKSLGTVVIGGLLVATVLTLVIVPAVFTLFDRGGRRRRLAAANVDAMEPPAREPEPASPATSR